MEDTYRLFQEFNRHVMVITARYAAQSELRFRAKRVHYTKQKYDLFSQVHPEVLRRAPDSYLASYLDVSEGVLKRMREMGGEKML